MANLIKWIKDRKDDVVDVFDANTARDQQKRIAAGQPRMYQEQQAQQRPQAPAQPRPSVNPLQDLNNSGINVRPPTATAPSMVTNNQPTVQAPQKPNNSLLRKATNLVGDLAVKPVTNTVAGAIVEPTRSLVAGATHNNAAMQAAEARKSEAMSRSLPGMVAKPVAGLVNTAVIAPGRTMIAQATGNKVAQANAEALQAHANSPREFVSNAGQAITMAVGGPVANRIATPVTSRLAAMNAPRIVSNTVGKVAGNAVPGYAFDVSTNFEDSSKSGAQMLKPGLATALSAGIPLAAATPEAVRIANSNIPRTYYRGAPVAEAPNFVTQNKALAQEFASDTGGQLQNYRLAPKNVLDVNNPQHNTQVKSVVPEDTLARLQGKTPSGVFSPEDEMLARSIASKLGFPGVKFDERSAGQPVPRVLQQNPYSVGITDPSALKAPLADQLKEYIRNPKYKSGQSQGLESSAGRNGTKGASTMERASSGPQASLGNGSFKNTIPPEEKIVDSGKMFYHGTNNPELKTLADLQPGRKTNNSGRNRVYITENPEIAKNFGKNVLSQRLYGKHLNASDIGQQASPDPIVPKIAAKEFADYKTNPLLTERDRRVFENSFVRDIPNNTIIEDTPNIHKYLASKGYTTITVPRVHSDVSGSRTETILIDKRAFQPPHDAQETKMAKSLNRSPNGKAPYPKLQQDLDQSVRRPTGTLSNQSIQTSSTTDMPSGLRTTGSPQESIAKPQSQQLHQSSLPNNIPRNTDIDRSVQEALKNGKSLDEVTHEYMQKRGTSYSDAKSDVARIAEESRIDLGFRDNKVPIKDKTDAIAIQEVVSNKKLSDAAKKAQIDGKEVNFYAKNDANGRSVGLERFNPKEHSIEGGLVRDQDGRVLGNHVKVDDTGIQINIGGEAVNMDALLGDTRAWKNINRVSETLDRNIQKAAPDDATYRKVRSFVIDNKNTAEANMRVDIKRSRDQLKDWKSEIDAVKPRRVGQKEYYSDLFNYIEKKTNKPDMVARYGNDAVAKIDAFVGNTRKLYDDLLDRTNDTLIRFGQEPVQKRKNYITHLQEEDLWKKSSLGADIFGHLREGITGEAQGATRGAIPANIAGRSENFKPIKKWNRFHQSRTGDQAVRDPFQAIDAYLEPALFNIHMTEPAMRARSIETALRTADTLLKDNNLATLQKEVKDNLLGKYGGERNHLTVAFQEYANALAGKTNRYDRIFADSGKSGQALLSASRATQQIAARSSIVGNFSSATAQALNLPINIGVNGIRSTTRGIFRTLAGRGPQSQSEFLKARYTDANSIYRGKFDKTMDVASTPLKLIEQSFAEIGWNSSYETALKKGLRGKAAVREADRIAERFIAGRGIADMPEMYRSQMSRNFLQYTLEVTAQYKSALKDTSLAGKIKFAAATMAMNYAYNEVTGRKPLPDFFGAALETIKDFTDSQNDESGLRKGVHGAQRLASEAVSAVPVASVTANLAPKDFRKKVFGSDSDLGRYDGTIAPINTLTKTTGGAIDALSGNTKKGVQDMLAAVPLGAQIRKTWQGGEAALSGEIKDNKGNVIGTPGGGLDTARGLLFGKNAMKGTREYYDNGSTGSVKSANSGDLGDSIRDMESQKKKYKSAVKKELSKEDQELFDLNKTQRQQLIGKGLVSQDRFDEIDRKVDSLKEQYGQGETKKTKQANDTEYNDFKKKYDRKIKNGEYSTTEKIKADKELKKLETGKDFDKEIRDLYSLGGSSKKDLYTYLTTPEKGKDKQKMADQIVAYGDALVNAGIIDKNKFRTSKGVVKFDSSKSRGGGRKGRKGGGGSIPDLKSIMSASGAIKAPSAPNIKVSGKGNAPQYKRVNLKSYAVQKANTSTAKIKVKKLA